MCLSEICFVARDGMTPQRAVRLMNDICAGVGVAHRQGLLHRDLKPDNVIVVPPSHEGDEETAKVVDFGLAKVRDVAAATALTHTGAVIGTLYYMSPEQCSGEELDARADVYSLGRDVLRDADWWSAVSLEQSRRPDRKTSARAASRRFRKSLEYRRRLKSVCLRALAKDRNQRQPDAIAFGRELQNALTAPATYQPGSFSYVTTQPVEVDYLLPSDCSSH